MVKSEFAEHMKDLSVLANQITAESDNFALFNKMRQIAKRLSNIVDKKDAYNAGHSERKACYAVSMARELGLNPFQIEIVQLVALLHDIGKIGISNNILQKSGKLDSMELKTIQKHPLMSERILTPIGLSEDMLQAIRYHHECPDGTGYPDGLSGDDIPLIARIVKVSDAFTAMIEQRPYRAPLSMQDATDQLIELAGQGFDTKVVKALIRVIEYERKKYIPKRDITTPKILVVKDEGITLKSLLQHQSFETISVNSGQEALQFIFEIFPNLVVLSKTIKDISPYQFCRRLKNDPRTSTMPIIVLTKRKNSGEEISFLNEGANDYLTISASDSDILIARIKSHISHYNNNVLVNPLTGLYGGLFITERIKMCLSNKKTSFSILFIDIDNFKIFNDRFGFLKGDELIKAVSQILISTVEKLGNEGDLIGHHGGDDFIVITTPDKIDAICKKIIMEFDSHVSSFYSPQERERGFITVTNKSEKLVVYPLTTISIGIVSNKDKKINNYYEIEEISKQVMESAKEIHKSIYY